MIPTARLFDSLIRKQPDGDGFIGGYFEKRADEIRPGLYLMDASVRLSIVLLEFAVERGLADAQKPCGSEFVAG